MKWLELRIERGDVMESSRTRYSARNTTVGLISRIIAILCGYIVRIVFTHVLSAEYVGVNGLFSNIVSILSLSEMGIESAIAYALYKPIAEGDEEQQRAIIALFRKLYVGVAAFVMAAGLLVIPFMGYIIKDADSIPDITYIYILYLVNSAMSYLLVYKKTLLDAHQLKYIGVSARAVSWVAQDAIQIVILLVTGNLILYLYVYILTTIVSNLYISWRANREYPFLKKKDYVAVETDTKRDMVKNIKAMFMHQLGNVVVNNSDNLIISYFVGIVSVGCYSNYMLVIGSVKQILNEAVDGISASVGNLGVTSDEGHIKKVYKAVLLFNNWGFGLCAMCLYAAVSPFVELSFGSKYVLHFSIVFLMCLNFFILGIEKASNIFHNSLGLFWYDRYKSLAEAVMNLVLSIVLAGKFGMFGVLLGTTISSITTTLWVEPYVIYKHRFKESPISYYVLMAVYVAQTAAAWFVSNRAAIWMVSLTHAANYIAIIAVKIITVVITANVVYMIFNIRNDDFYYLLNKFLKLVKERKCKDV